MSKDPWLLVIELLLLFGMGGIVPMGVSVLFGREGRLGALERSAVVAMLLGAPCYAIALRFRGTPWASILAAPWAVATALLALAGLRRIARTRPRHLAEVASDVALMYLGVGGAWAYAYASGMVVLRFAGTEVLLTATHFHFAGFGACFVAGQAGRALRGRAQAVYRVATLGMLSCIALLAIGITLSHLVETLAAWIVAGSMFLQGMLLLRIALLPRRLPGRVLLAVAGGCTVVSGSLAAWFALLGFRNLGDGALETMVRWHGLLNAVGFVGCASLAFRLEPPPSLDEPDGLRVADGA